MKRRVRVEIDLSALVRNYGRICGHVAPLDVLCVLKANAYALGVGEYARALFAAGCRNFGVAEPYEAIELCGILEGRDASVQILSSVLPDEIGPMVALGVRLPVTDLEEARLLGAAAVRAGKCAKVHLKIDSGMGRLGILAKDAAATALAVSKIPGIEIEGVFSHCPVAYDPHDPFTKKQIALFKNVVAAIRAAGVNPPKIHMAASDAINNFPETAKPPFTMVRSGINLHGSFDPNGLRALELEPVLALKTRIAQVRSLPAGTTLGYGRTWCLAEDSRIATICAGYADGLPLALTNRGTVLIHGKRCKIVGRISMDYATVDVSDVPDAAAGDEVTCLGSEGGESISPDDWAAVKGTHAYDIICSLGSRVERVFVNKPRSF